MRITKTCQAILFLLNHLVAAHVPLEAIAPLKHVGRASELDVWQKGTPATHENHLQPSPVELTARAPDSGNACDRKAKCKKKKIRDPTNASKCKRCPPLMKADPTHTICIQDKDIKDEEKKKTYKDKIKEKAQQMMKDFKDKIKERIQQKKPAKTTEWEKKDATRRDRLNNKKLRRIAQCLPLVAAAIGTQAMLEMADGGFSEDLLDGIDSDTLDLWPGTDIDDNYLDKTMPDDLNDITGEDYVNQFLQVGDAANAKRSIDLQDVDNETETDSGISEQGADKRDIFGDIIAGFVTIGRAIAAAATRAAGQVGQAAARATKFFSTRKPNLKKPGESKLSRAEQKDKAKEVSQNKNWKNCLRGEKPEK
ncbi:hypothetical protein HBI56_157380 [Parastagonospora nodorum]|uniref:Uncharacterized protein n=2 Tax=Phaeosphaeria nodorum (strain SN15 / ATCC MYA-4574 / FGSC 10173) TaxID=321614 RepID=A0A7U2ESE4_PHANO|nr:hypothetical protein SNOG_02357 [Parastagonospora nodorum SN15]KAH3907365.1 hypothetical protein HBH56_188120 [Parastagonospora nodorum]EAT90569.1 hypothetical protein SNOG_02357 [Parastagonospora nodorum SN15]KAH3925158.1 hypothetical protein HBH54_183930 [Parastagonospora nodorum]KAH3954052.1 hypothetical protein HBH53_023280 [Parastagonospora nodorum]KAH3963834.1 hypothetical protein HBH51_163110 [Parastagonospora nodorum]